MVYKSILLHLPLSLCNLLFSLAVGLTCTPCTRGGREHMCLQTLCTTSFRAALLQMFYVWGLWVTFCLKNRIAYQKKKKKTKTLANSFIVSCLYCLIKKKNTQKTEVQLRMLPCIPLKLRGRWKSPGVATEANIQLQPDARWTSVNCVFDSKRGGKKVKNMQIINQRCKPVACLPLGMFWTINTQVLPVQNFQ